MRRESGQTAKDLQAGWAQLLLVGVESALSLLSQIFKLLKSSCYWFDRQAKQNFCLTIDLDTSFTFVQITYGISINTLTRLN